MVVMFSLRRVIKRSKLYIRIVLLTLIIFYILPKLMTMLWEFSNPGLKIRDQHLLEKPLRVMTEAKTAVSLQYDID
ncbi:MULTISPECIES: hypothetical protein [Sporomusa]|jgi:type III secretory pathway component EscU|uniref:hypothetical protein n=1 Tax=Sporomusa TaxID=2375 RepID=UPI0016681F5A|nr:MULTISPECIES: hypothetical protein [Sporomusa]MCM0760090.1 hypothetical protein [Sporomusa sphaeroides DSM 2875]HML31594.1 hypothetical protein [Sporomusa sphaeroides]